jgi:hypothetical protein
MHVQSFAHLTPTSMPELLFTVAILSAALAVVVLTVAVCGPGFYREARTWFAPELPAPTWGRARIVRLDDARRRRELGKIVSPFSSSSRRF